ncbi:MAG: CvpA family protein [Oscillospiraceae bacterium]|nr:CvpA family protein [Oscillospiraceae bacterium]
MRLILDLVLLLIVGACIWDGYKRGLIGGLIGILILMLALAGGNYFSASYASQAVPVLEPFIDGYIDSQKTKNTVLQEMGYGGTDLSLDDVLEADSSLRYDYAMYSTEELGFHTDRAQELAQVAVRYANQNDVSMTRAIIDTLCDTICYVVGLILCFLLILILLSALSNIGYMAFRLPDHLRLLDELGGAVIGFLKGFLYCVLLCWVLSFLGLLIGQDTLDHTLLARFFMTFRFLTKGFI